jgi:Flp pilus assembly protein TadG
MARHGDGRRSSGGIVIVLALAAGLVACGGGSAPKASVSKATTTTGTIALTEPAQGATVGRSFTVRGSGSAFEGTLLWTLTGGGVSPISGSTTAGVTEAQPFQFTVNAPAEGSYTLTVYRESAADGARADAVSRTLTVR